MWYTDSLALLQGGLALNRLQTFADYMNISLNIEVTDSAAKIQISQFNQVTKA